MATRKKREHKSRVSTLTPSPDGRWLVSGEEAGPWKVWDAASTKVAATLAGACEGRHYVRRALFHPDGERLFTVCTCAIGALRLRGGKKLFRRKINRSLACAAFHPKGPLVAMHVGNPPGIVYVDLATGQQRMFDGGWIPAARGISIRPDGLAIVASEGRSDDPTLSVRDLSDLRKTPMGYVHMHKGHKSAITAFFSTPGGESFVSADQETVFVWRWGKARPVRSYKRQFPELAPLAGDLRFVIGSEEGVALHTVDSDKAVRVLAKKSLLMTFGVGDDDRWCAQRVAVDPLGRRAAAALDDQALWVWDLGTGKAVATFALPAPDDLVSCALTDAYAAVGYGDGGVAFFPLER